MPAEFCSTYERRVSKEKRTPENRGFCLLPIPKFAATSARRPHLADGRGTLSERHPKVALIKAVARAHGWYEKVLQGKALDMRSLARQAGLTERYIGKVFACALLAPDIIESILEGRQPPDLTFEKLCHGIPLSWAEQRSKFGFPQSPRVVA